MGCIFMINYLTHKKLGLGSESIFYTKLQTELKMMKGIVGVLLFELLLVHCATKEVETRAKCGEDVSLECHGVDFNSMNFISVAWYKLNNDQMQGIIRKAKDNPEPRRYNYPRPTSIGQKNNLILRNVTSKDSGIYECGVNAKVGGRNHKATVSLNVSECVTKPVPTTMTNVFNTTENPECSPVVEDLPVVWSVTGYLVVGAAKIVLSLLVISVIRRTGIRSRRQKCMR